MLCVLVLLLKSDNLITCAIYPLQKGTRCEVKGETQFCSILFELPNQVTGVIASNVRKRIRIMKLVFFIINTYSVKKLKLVRQVESLFEIPPFYVLGSKKAKN